MIDRFWLLLIFGAGIAAVMVLNRLGRISGKEAEALVKNGALLLDVRSPSEFKSGHLDGALNVPVGELDRRLAELGAKERPLVVYCASGARSRFASRTLKKAGFLAVHDIGPMSAYPG